MNWLQSNWLWILFVAAFLGMHMFGHGGHGHGGGHGRHRGEHDHGGSDQVETPSVSGGTGGLSRPQPDADPWQEG